MAASSAAVERKAVFAYGRFQPPTIGHKILIDAVVAKAAVLGADPYIFVSSKVNESNAKWRGKWTDTNKNPLTVEDRVLYLKKMYPKYADIFINTETDIVSRRGLAHRDPANAVHHLLKKYTNVIMLSGSDRKSTYEKFLGIPIMQAGENRKKSVPGKKITVEEMSGSDMRDAAMANDKDTFREGVMIGSMTEKDADDLMQLVQDGTNGIFKGRAGAAAFESAGAAASGAASKSRARKTLGRTVNGGKRKTRKRR